MTRLVFCTKLRKEAEGLASLPFPGPLGQRIYAEISKEAWALWLKQQTLLINEQRLSLTDLEARRFLMRELEAFLFGQV